METVDIKGIAEFELLLSKLKYESELKRQDSLIQQAGNMQSAFAFTTAALFMAAPIMFQYRGVLSFEFIFWGTAITTSILLSCLFAATMAQNRKKQHQFPEIEEVIKYIEDHEKVFSDENTRSKYLVDTYKVIQKDLSAINESRVRWVERSMKSFYIALAACLIWFVVSLIIIY